MGQTALCWAAEHGSDAVVELLLKKGADVDTRSKNGNSPLLWAIENGQEATADLLLEKEASIEDPSIFGWAFVPSCWYPCQVMIVVPQFDRTRELGIAQRSSSTGRTPFSRAVRR